MHSGITRPCLLRKEAYVPVGTPSWLAACRISRLSVASYFLFLSRLGLVVTAPIPICCMAESCKISLFSCPLGAAEGTYFISLIIKVSTLPAKPTILPFCYFSADQPFTDCLSPDDSSVMSRWYQRYSTVGILFN